MEQKNDKLYSCAANVYQNVNTTSLGYYDLLRQKGKEKRNFSYCELMQLGSEVGMSARRTGNEIVGCLYANFMTKKFSNDNYYITNRALRDFNLYFSEAEWKTSEFTMTIDYIKNKENYKIAFWVMDTIPIRVIEMLKDKKWTYNKSDKRCRKKCKDVTEVVEQIKNLFDAFESSMQRYSGSLFELVKDFGYYRKMYHDYSCNLNFRGVFSSTSILNYVNVYKEILNEEKNPVDWGGDIITYNKIAEILRNHKEEGNFIEVDKFIDIAQNDGMIRQIDETDYTLTGHGATVINEVRWEHQNKRLSIVIRRRENSYYILLGDNTLYGDRIRRNLDHVGFLLSDGWYESLPLNSSDNVVEQLKYILLNFYSGNELEPIQLSFPDLG